MPDREVDKFWEWVAESDACDFCQSMDGTIHPVDSPMDTHPNCRCTQIMYIPDGLESDNKALDATIEKLKETNALTLAAIKGAEVPTVRESRVILTLRKMQKRERYIRFVYGDAEKATSLMRQYGLNRVYWSADLHPMTRKAMLAKALSEEWTDAKFKLEVFRAKKKDMIRMRKSGEEFTRKDLKPNALDPLYNPEDEDNYYDDWFK